MDTITFDEQQEAIRLGWQGRSLLHPGEHLRYRNMAVWVLVGTDGEADSLSTSAAAVAQSLCDFIARSAAAESVLEWLSSQGIRPGDRTGAMQGIMGALAPYL